MSELNQKTEYGIQVAASMMGEPFARGMRDSASSDGFMSGISRRALEFCFADGWGDDGLDRKTKSIATISVLIVSHAPHAVKFHTKVGVKHGLTIKDLRALLIQLLPYVGFPAISAAEGVMIEALRELGMDPGGSTPQELAEIKR